MLELLLSAINRTGSPCIRPLHIPRGAAKQADIGSEAFRFSSTPLPIIAKQEFFWRILERPILKTFIVYFNLNIFTRHSTTEFLQKHTPIFDVDQPSIWVILSCDQLEETTENSCMQWQAEHLHGDSVMHKSHGAAIGCCDRFRPPTLSLPRRPVPINVNTRREVGSN